LTYLVENDFGAYGRIIADGLADVFEELHAIELVDLVGHIRSSEYAAIEDLLQSSTELFFKDGTLTFAWNARVDLPWDGVPTVTLGMEFKNQTVSAFFNMSFQAHEQVVQVVGILFDPECRDAAERRFRLRQALVDAHLPRKAVGRLNGPAGKRPGRPLWRS
jgi:hypothetical protein